jgi:hypothetical protein
MVNYRKMSDYILRKLDIKLWSKFEAVNKKFNNSKGIKTRKKLNKQLQTILEKYEPLSKEIKYRGITFKSPNELKGKKRKW